MKPEVETHAGLDDYVKTAHGNAARALSAGGVWIELLRDVEGAFSRGADTLKPTPGTIVGAFLAGSHSSWLAAANLALSAHLAESFQPLRSCLESAFYGYHIRIDPLAWDRWSKRPTLATIDANAARETDLKRLRRDVGREFSVTTIAKSLSESDSRLSKRAVRLYDELIDYGAHFNFPVLNHAYNKLDPPEDLFSSEIKILNAKESYRVFCFQKLAEVGIAALSILNVGIADEWDRFSCKALSVASPIA